MNPDKYPVRVPGMSDESVQLCLKLAQKELEYVNQQIASYYVEHRVNRGHTSQWVGDMKNRREKVIRTIDELRRIGAAYRTLRQQREAHSA